MTKDEALKLALEALEVATTPLAKDRQEILRARAAIKEALAQPEQEPFCYHDGRNIVGKEYADHSDVFPLYTTPQPAVPDGKRLAKELDGVIADVEEGDGFDDVCLDTVKYVRDALLMAQPEQSQVEEMLRYEIDALEAKLAECRAQPEQEPVAHTLNCVCGAVWDIKADGGEEMVHTPDTTPPQRTWVGLTDEDKKEVVTSAENALWADVDLKWRDALMEFTEAKLREKNV